MHWEANHEDTRTCSDDRARRVRVGDGVTSGRDKIVADVNASSCEVAGFDFSDVTLRRSGSDVAVISYLATQDATCDGKKLPPKVYSTSIHVHKNGKWKSMNYQETPVD